MRECVGRRCLALSQLPLLTILLFSFVKIFHFLTRQVVITSKNICGKCHNAVWIYSFKGVSMLFWKSRMKRVLRTVAGPGGYGPGKFVKPIRLRLIWRIQKHGVSDKITTSQQTEKTQITSKFRQCVWLSCPFICFNCAYFISCLHD